MGAGLVRESMAAYRKSFELDPLWERSVLGYALTATELGESDAVDRALDRFAAASPNRFAVESARGMVGSRRGDLVSAMQHLSLALTLAPEDPHDQLWELARIARAVGDSDGLLRLTSSHAGLHQAWAPIFDSQDAPARARTAPPPSWWNAQNVVAEMRNLLNAGRGDLLLEQLDRLGTPQLDAYQPEEGGSVPAYSLMALALRAAGRDVEAAKLLSAARAQVDRMDANHYTYFIQDLDRAAVSALEGRSDEAVAALRRAVEKQWRGQVPEWAVDPGDEPAFASLRGRDDFEQVRRQLAGNIARLRPQVEAILARTPLPVVDTLVAGVAAGDGTD
jgi:tetratricopeptide (TPR) repeat protein